MPSKPGNRNSTNPQERRYEARRQKGNPQGADLPAEYEDVAPSRRVGLPLPPEMQEEIDRAAEREEE